MPLPLPQHFTTCNWAEIPETEHPGETGTAFWKTQQFDGVRVRMVRYSPGYLADHWCKRGHILLVLTGVLHTEVDGHEPTTLRSGEMYVVADDASSHRSRTESGATLFIVD